MTAAAGPGSSALATTCDTSVLIPTLLSWHEHHQVARASIGEVGAVPGHVLVETYSVLTRLPAPHRLSPAVVVGVLRRIPVSVLALSADRHLDTLDLLARHDVKGGAVYDGLIAATALEHGSTLLTLDRRAVSTYEVLGARVHVL